MTPINLKSLFPLKRCLQTTKDYCGIAHAGDNSKSGLLIKAYLLPVHFFCLFKNRVKSLQEKLK